jgi:uncharacterized phage protein (TIGR02216 family)
MTDGTFGQAAVRAYAGAAVLLGWRPGEFWDATPAELAAALQGLTDEQTTPLSAAALAALRAQFPDD